VSWSGTAGNRIDIPHKFSPLSLLLSTPSDPFNTPLSITPACIHRPASVHTIALCVLFVSYVSKSRSTFGVWAGGVLEGKGRAVGETCCRISIDAQQPKKKQTISRGSVGFLASLFFKTPLIQRFSVSPVKGYFR